jgi:hypothetical protein
MTLEELYDNYEFKVTKRALMREFPFIKNVYVKDPASLEKYQSFIFLDVDINPYELSQQYGLKMDKTVDKYLRRGEPYWVPYLSMYVRGVDSVEDTLPIKRAIAELLSGIHNSVAIPLELKLGKELEVSGYHANPNTVPPDMMSGMEGYPQ